MFDFGPVCMGDFSSISANNYCDDNDYQMLVVVSSKIGYIEHRTRVRNTWANAHRMNTSFTKVVFATGAYFTNEEQMDFHDLIYTNLYDGRTTDMFFPGLCYVRKYCPNIRCLLHTNTDQILNLNEFEKLCKKYAKKQNKYGLILGDFLRRKKINFVFKNSYIKYCSNELFMVVGQRAIDRLLNAVHRMNWFNSLFASRENSNFLTSGLLPTFAKVQKISIRGISDTSEPKWGCRKNRSIAFNVKFSSKNGIFSNTVSQQNDEYLWHYMNLFRQKNC